MTKIDKNTVLRFLLINGFIPFLLIILFLLAGSNYFFPPGYFIYGWNEILLLSTFVSLVPGVAHWFLFGISLVGAEATANLTISGLILLGCLLVIMGLMKNIANSPKDKIKGRNYILIGGILTLPLGFLALYVFIKTKSGSSDIGFFQRVKIEFRKNSLPYILLIPSLFFLAFTYIIPIIRGFYITLFTYKIGSKEYLSRAFTSVPYSCPTDPVDPSCTADPLLWTIHAILGGLQHQNPIFIGFDNYLQLFSQTTDASSFQTALNNNIYFVILFVPGVIAVALGLALLLNNKLLKGENTYTTIFYMPVITSVLVSSVIWLRIVFPQEGLLTLIVTTLAPILDLLFSIFNIISFGIFPGDPLPSKISWISEYLMESVALLSIWRSVGFDVLILLAGLKSIPSSLYEAASIDGHGSWSQFKNITLPQIKGPLGVVVILELVNGWQIFQEFYGLNLAQHGGNYSLAVYLISNYASPPVMSFASTVGYFIFGMTAYFGLLDRAEIKGVLKGLSIFTLLAILFSIPSNRTGIPPKSVGLNLSWFSFDVLFLILALISLLFYFYKSILKEKQLEIDVHDLRITGYFILFTTPFYFFNGYNIITRTGAGSTPIWFLKSSTIGFFFLIISLFMIFMKNLIPYLKNMNSTSFLFSNDESVSDVN